MDIKDLRILMPKIFNESGKLFVKADIDIMLAGSSERPPDPIEWVYNQDIVLIWYDDFKTDEELTKNNSLYDYFKFMIENYPPEFGNKLREEESKLGYCKGYNMYKKLEKEIKSGNCYGGRIYRKLMIKHNFQ